VGFRVERIGPEYPAKAIGCIRVPFFAKGRFTFFEPVLSGLLLATAVPTCYFHSVLPLSDSPKLLSSMKLAGTIAPIILFHSPI
jgi:hypothetical protein